MALVATGCTGAYAPLAAPTARPVKQPAPKAVVKATLTAFRSCPDALAALRKAAKASVTPYGLPTGTPTGGLEFAAAGPATGVAAPAAGAAASAAAPANGAAAGAGVGAPAYSGTNDYTAGVDEPDLVKTDGLRIVTVSGGTLEVIDAASRQVTGRLDLASAGVQGDPVNLLLSGDHALLFAPYASMPADMGQASPAGAADSPAEYGPRFILVDLAGQPRVLASYAIQGALVDARLVGSVVRIVTDSQPVIEYPALPASLSAARRTAAYRAVTGQAGLDAWLPQYESEGGGVTTAGRVPCTAVSRPARYSGTNLLTVLTFDLSASTLGTGDPVSVVADGDTVYGTTTSLYVASGQTTGPFGVAEPMYAPGVGADTQIYRFDITGSGAPRFVASGSVPGYLVDQYAMSEWNGYLRVATTTGTSWAIADGEPTGAQTSSSAVYELTTSGPVMRIVGKVTGLGTTERIYAVRFMGPVGYVVTFRQTDPLYTLDLSDPSRPRLVGALGLTGYSAYLDPVSASRLIGIGQQADSVGHVLGTQVSLFDVSDLASPARLAMYALAGSMSDAQFDPHAFLYWPANQLVVVPIQESGMVAAGTSAPMQVPQSGALVLRVTDSGITQVGFIRQPLSSAYGSSIERSLVIGQTLWTVSPAGVLASDLTTLREQAWLPFPAVLNSDSEPPVASAVPAS
jgi:hypothetical protein